MNYQQHFGLLVFTYHEGIPARSFKVLSIKLWKIHRFNMAEGSVGAPVYRSSILLPSTMNLSEYEQRIFKNKNKQVNISLIILRILLNFPLIGACFPAYQSQDCRRRHLSLWETSRCSWSDGHGQSR